MKLQEQEIDNPYILNGENSDRAIKKGLAEADWYQCPVPRDVMRELLKRKDGPAIRDTFIWFGLIIGFGYLTCLLWGSFWAILPYLCYAALYASTSDSRWHESSHGTAFKTDWMNNALYEVASFMVMRESVIWRWSHTRHHSDTIIVGRDPEIVVPRPPDIKGLLLGFFNVGVYPKYFKRILLHSVGRMEEDETMYVPESEYNKVFSRARIYLFIYAAVIGFSLYTHSLLPILLVGGCNAFGTWLMPIYGLTQHAGLAENVLDHRLNCRTVYMNVVNRFLYWNMNYHVEHHMFPLVPYHALPALHDAIKDDTPEPYPNLINAWMEIIPALLKQVKDPTYYVKRKLPEAKERQEEGRYSSDKTTDNDGWIEVCSAADLGTEDVIRFDYKQKTFALYRDNKGKLYATDGICTHGNTHLADGLVKGKIVECPKHNGRFNLKDGSPARAPICRGLATYPIEERGGRIHLNTQKAGGCGARKEKSYELRVVSNKNVATFIKELVFELVNKNEKIEFKAGDYLQFNIPQFEQIDFKDLDVPQPYAEAWENNHLFDLSVSNDQTGRRNNYSLANNPQAENVLKFNIRIAMPPPGQDCPPGVGSSYMWNLKAGDVVSAIGPFGDFHIKPTKKEMVYIGGGAGMAPLRSHIEQLFEVEKSSRKVSFWYGARSKQEIFYQDYFEALSKENPNFSFNTALSNALKEDKWAGLEGFIHEVVLKEYLANHENVNALEFYLCGPPQMITAVKKMLSDLNVKPENIAYDEF